MAFMIHPTTAAPFVSASRMTPRPSLPIPSPLGGNAKESVVMAVRPNFWFWQTPAAVTVAPPGPGRRKSRHKYAIGSALRHHCSLSYRCLQVDPIEHRLFSEISKNWAAEPLNSYEKMLKFIRTTSTQTGLVVTAYLDRSQYPTGLKPDPRLISSLRLTHGKLLPRWNYTIRPNL